MLGQIFKKKSIEANPAKALKEYGSLGPYQKDFYQIIIRDGLENGAKNLNELVENRCGISDTDSNKRRVYGALLTFIGENLIEAYEENGQKRYGFTRLGESEDGWLLPVASLAEIVSNHYKSSKMDDMDEDEDTRPFYGSKRRGC